MTQNKMKTDTVNFIHTDHKYNLLHDYTVDLPKVLFIFQAMKYPQHFMTATNVSFMDLN